LRGGDIGECDLRGNKKNKKKGGNFVRLRGKLKLKG
jgi:hypothetical protein